MRLMEWMTAGIVGAGIVVVAMAGCGENPLTDRVERLEAKVDELEASQEEQQKKLLARLDQIPVTAENSADVAEVRAKLAQSEISEAEFQTLRRRVEALEKVVNDWSQIVVRYQRSVYTVIHYIWHEDEDVEGLLTFIGTAFAVGNTALITNGHILDALVYFDEDLEAFNERWEMDLEASWLLVQNLTNSLRHKSNYYWVSRWKYHENWDDEDVYSPDVALLRPWEGTISSHYRMPLATPRAVRRMRTGTPIGTLGFPGELQFNSWTDLYPVATFKNGTVSAIRMPDEASRYSVGEAYIVQHNLDLTGGTSGSPIFTAGGEVVAVNNSGIEALALTLGGDPVRVSQGSLGFGIRADKIHELLNQAGVAAKPVGGGTPGARLDGRNLSDLEIGRMDDDLTERLKDRLGL